MKRQQSPSVNLSVASARLTGVSSAIYPSTRDGDGREVYDRRKKPRHKPATMSDPTLATIEALADRYHAQLKQAGQTRAELNAVIQWAKDNGYSYPRLSKASGLSIATVQNIVSGRYLNEKHTRGDY